MFFKNLMLFRLTTPLITTAFELTGKLEQLKARPCGSHEHTTFGFTPVHGDVMVHEYNNRYMIAAKKEERVLPPAAVNDALSVKVNELKAIRGRNLSKKERTALKDEIIFEMLPRAFTASSVLHAYIDTTNGWIVVDAASSSKAEELISALRKALGSLPAVPFQTVLSPATIMSSWLVVDDAVPAEFTIDDECELRAHDPEDKAVVRCKHLPLDTAEVRNHIEVAAMLINKLALTWNDRLSFVLDADLSVKRLAFNDILQEEHQDIEAENVDFTIMTLELGKLIPRLVELFGGYA